MYYISVHLTLTVQLLPISGAKDEDDGILSSIVFDGEREQSYLLLLDARTLTTLARAYLPMNLPWSAHGMHFPEATFAALNGLDDASPHQPPTPTKEEL